jgi:hypothetical protein
LIIVTKTCSCGARFQLHVELAVHRQKTGHALLETEKLAPPPLGPPSTPSRAWKKTVVAGATLLSLLGITAGLNFTVRTYTSWQGTANVLLLP